MTDDTQPDGTYRCPDCGTELESVRRRGEFDTPRVSGLCTSCKDWKVIEKLSTDTDRGEEAGRQ